MGSRAFQAGRVRQAYPKRLDPTRRAYVNDGGRARRGASGALNPQSALAGLNPCLRAGSLGTALVKWR